MDQRFGGNIHLSSTQEHVRVCAYRLESTYSPPPPPIHSCGDVDVFVRTIFIGIGLTALIPFNLRLWDVTALQKNYRGRLSFTGVITQRPFHMGLWMMFVQRHQVVGSGSEGGYIFCAAHDVEGDVPLENILAFIDVIQSQPGYRNN